MPITTDNISIPFVVLATDGTPTSGLTVGSFTLTLTNPSGSAVTGLAVTDAGGGWYKAAKAATWGTAGLYTFVAEYSGMQDAFVGIEVDAPAASDAPTVEEIFEADPADYDADADSFAARVLAILAKTNTIGTSNATILTPVAPSGTLVINRGVSMTKWASMVYDCRLIADFDEATHPVKLFIDYGNGSKLVKTIGVGAILETASAIQVDLAPTLTSAVTRDMPLGSFPAQIVAFTDANAERHVILELTIQVKAPGFDYSASDT